MSHWSGLFNDLYQLTMARAYLSSRSAKSKAVFELFFRKCPFGGEYAVFSGLQLVREILENFSFEKEEIRFLKNLPNFKDADESFFTQLENLDLKDIEVWGLEEGQLAFPRIPLLQVRGPLYKLQLLETSLLNAINYSTLVATYARRLRLVAGESRVIEFGMRRAQGPNGAMTASLSSFIGGCDASSNVLAGMQFGIPIVGTMAHSFVQSFVDIREEDLNWNGQDISSLFKEVLMEDKLQTHRGELGAFLAYAKAFPTSALFLVDTYDSLRSGIPNAIRIFKILRKLRYPITGIRLDSGDLVYLSQQARKKLDEAGFSDAQIFASNELTEDIIESLQKQGAEINAYGVGTHLVTCYDQPALGGVYKLVEIDDLPRLKRSDQTEKTTLPGPKQVYRLYGKNSQMLLDYVCLVQEPSPQPGQKLETLHPFDPFKKAVLVPEKVEVLLKPIFKAGQWLPKESVHDCRQKSLDRMKNLRHDISRRQNPTPYKVSVSPKLKKLFEQLYLEASPPAQLNE